MIPDNFIDIDFSKPLSKEQEGMLAYIQSFVCRYLLSYSFPTNKKIIKKINELFHDILKEYDFEISQDELVDVKRTLTCIQSKTRHQPNGNRFSFSTIMDIEAVNFKLAIILFMTILPLEIIKDLKDLNDKECIGIGKCKNN